MPKIVLKPNSAEYADAKIHNAIKCCDMPGCDKKGEHKAPKHRGLNEYYFFCREHIQEYNKAWNFFDGMNDSEVEDHILKSMYGFRPTWKYGVNSGSPEDELHEKIWESYHGEEEKRHKKQSNRIDPESRHSQEYKALAIMGLEPPIDLAEIKTQYKKLAKKHHPDLNKGCAKSEARLKEINMAYTILKLAYDNFNKLD